MSPKTGRYNICVFPALVDTMDFWWMQNGSGSSGSCSSLRRLCLLGGFSPVFRWELWVCLPRCELQSDCFQDSPWAFRIWPKTPKSIKISVLSYFRSEWSYSFFWQFPTSQHSLQRVCRSVLSCRCFVPGQRRAYASFMDSQRGNDERVVLGGKWQSQIFKPLIVLGGFFFLWHSTWSMRA